MRKVLVAVVGLAVVGLTSLMRVMASDHDDGEIDQKGRALNLTDLYVFREGDQNPAASVNDLIFVMNTNPRSVARQQYFFSTAARYAFHVGRIVNAADNATGQVQIQIFFEFGLPNAAGQQQITMTVVRDGQSASTNLTTGGGAILTTPLASAATPTNNTVSLLGSTFTVFAGLREDPFFFDVESYFRVRAGALGTGPAVGFKPVSTAVDFTAGYNVNAVVLRVPETFLDNGTGTAVYDVHETIEIR